MSEDATEWWTDDPALVRAWAADRGLEPVRTERGDGPPINLVRDAGDADGEPIPWPAFLDRLADANLALLYRGPDAAEGVGSGAWDLVDRETARERAAAAEKTHDDADAGTNQLALSDTGEGEPVAFDRTGEAPGDDESIRERTDDASPRARRQGDTGTRDDRSAEASTAPTGDKRRAPTEHAAGLVLDTIREADPGPDALSRSDEGLVFANTGEEPIDLSGWRVRNERGREYRFPEGTTLAPGDRLTLHSGQGTDTATDYYWDVDEPVWPAGGETVFVETPAGERIVEKTYKGGR